MGIVKRFIAPAGHDEDARDSTWSAPAEYLPPGAAAPSGGRHVTVSLNAPRTFFTGRLDYRALEQQIQDAAAAEAAVAKLEHMRSETEAARQSHALVRGRRELLPQLHLVEALNVEKAVFNAMTERALAERGYVDAIIGRSERGKRDKEKTPAEEETPQERRRRVLDDYDHEIAVSGRRKRAAESEREAVAAEQALRAQQYPKPPVRKPAPPPAPPANEQEPEAPEFAAAFEEEERRQSIRRTARRREEQILKRADGDESRLSWSDREDLERVRQAERRALKGYDLGRAGIVIPDDEE